MHLEERWDFFNSFLFFLYSFLRFKRFIFSSLVSSFLFFFWFPASLLFLLIRLFICFFVSFTFSVCDMIPISRHLFLFFLLFAIGIILFLIDYVIHFFVLSAFLSASNCFFVFSISTIPLFTMYAFSSILLIKRYNKVIWFSWPST